MNLLDEKVVILRVIKNIVFFKECQKYQEQQVKMELQQPH